MQTPDHATNKKSNAQPQTGGLARRTVLKASALGTALSTLELAGKNAIMPVRSAFAGGRIHPAVVTLPDIQHDVSAFFDAPQLVSNGVHVQFPPVHTVFLTASLLRTPTLADKSEMDYALNTIESTYPFAPNGVIAMISYGLPYFERLPGGTSGPIYTEHMPVLNNDPTRPAFEEAVPAPTDANGDPGQLKLHFNVPVQIEHNDLLFTLRSDDSTILSDVVNWMAGSNLLAGVTTTSPAFGGLLTFTTSRAMFIQTGLPRQVAETNNLPYKDFINNESPNWMGFGDQQVHGSGPALITTFQGNPSARLTTAQPGDYFDNASVQHLSHDILDMQQWFDMLFPASGPGADGTFVERVQYMFHAPPLTNGNANQFLDGGGPAWLFNDFRGPHYANLTAAGIGTLASELVPGAFEKRIGHLSGLQRSSRAVDGTPMHIRMDGPGFDSLDVPDGSQQPKLHFTAFFPTAAFFQQMRINQAGQDLHLAETEIGIERFMTATRRQNFLVPPRRSRSFPLIEFV